MDKLNIEKLQIFGIPCYAFGSDLHVIETVRRLLKEGKGGYSMAINAEKLYHQRKNEKLRNAMINSILPVADGAGAVLALKLLHGIKAIKVNLPVLALRAINQINGTLIVYGTTPNRNQKATANIAKNYNQIRLLSSIDGFSDQTIIKNILLDKQPQLALIGLGSPKQEIFIKEMTVSCPHTLFIGCGGALDILSGEVQRAPNFMVDNNLEWLYRLIKQPSRIRRQLVLPAYLIFLLSEWLRCRVNKSY